MEGRLSPGTVFAGYRIRIAGRGGMGVVYRATQLALDRPVALKLVAPELAEDDDFRRRFKRESRLAASIDHANVITIHEAGEAEGQLYISMRYVEGDDLDALITRDGPLDPGRATGVVAQVAAALDAAHARGLIHRDIKPANVLIERRHDEEHAYLTDFGLTKHSDARSELTRTGQWVGTLDYAAPEQIAGGSVDARADIYALGCVLYKALAGSAPVGGREAVAKVYAHVNEEPAPVTEPRATTPTTRLAETTPAAARAAAPATQGRSRVPLMAAAALAAVAVVAVAVVALLAGADRNALEAESINTSSIAVGTSPAGVAVGGDGVWVGIDDEDAVRRIDPDSGEVADSIEVSEGGRTGRSP